MDDEFAPGYDHTWGVYDEDTGEWVLVGLRCKSELPGITIIMALEALEKKKLEQKSVALAKELEEEKKVFRGALWTDICACSFYCQTGQMCSAKDCKQRMCVACVEQYQDAYGEAVLLCGECE